MPLYNSTMLSKKRVTLNRLISYIESFTDTNTTSENAMDNVFKNAIKSNDEFKFETLKFGDSRNINDFPDKLKKIFDPFLKDFRRIGTRHTIDDNITNTSLYYSVLLCMLPELQKMTLAEQSAFVTKFRDKLIIYMSNEDMGKLKKDIMTSMIQFKSNKFVIKLISDYFRINIFILNIIDDKPYVMSNVDSYDLFQPNIFLVHHNETFEPLSYRGTFILKHTSEPIKKLVNVDKALITLMNDKKDYPFSIKLQDITKHQPAIKQPIVKEEVCEVQNEYEEVYPTESDTNVFIKDVEEKSNITFKLSPKMKLDELQNIAQKLKITLDKGLDKNGKKKSKTKGELIDEIQLALKKV